MPEGRTNAPRRLVRRGALPGTVTVGPAGFPWLHDTLGGPAGLPRADFLLIDGAGAWFRWSE